MTMTGLDVFDRTVHKTNSWLNELMEILGWHDRHKAYLALRVTLHALRDRHMAETLDELVAHLERRSGGAKIAVWAHNSYIGDARATEMGERGELNVGQLARTAEWEVGEAPETFPFGV